MIIFIGYEEKYPESYEVCKASIERFSEHHDIRPLRKKNLDMYTREYQGESTDFAFTRFLVPYLSDYKGLSLFCDGDFLWRSNPSELSKYIAMFMTVSVVKHPKLVTSTFTKMDGKTNRPYPRKYWSSLMLFNNSACKTLTPEYVNEAPAGALHGFEWANKIGNIPATYNHMIGYYNMLNPKADHFTDGGPWLEDYRDQPYAEEWINLHESLNS
ncbi:MAG: glycosyltransferase [Flavobacteriia bacterium]|nr:glycosyltransferase [Flavobacteriia bacterium]